VSPATIVTGAVNHPRTGEAAVNVDPPVAGADIAGAMDVSANAATAAVDTRVFVIIVGLQRRVP